MAFFVSVQGVENLSFSVPGWRLSRPQLDGLVEGLDGFLVPSQSVEGITSPDPGVKTLRVQLNRSVEVFDGLLVAITEHESQALLAQIFNLFMVRSNIVGHTIASLSGVEPLLYQTGVCEVAYSRGHRIFLAGPGKAPGWCRGRALGFRPTPPGAGFQFGR